MLFPSWTRHLSHRRLSHVSKHYLIFCDVDACSLTSFAPLGQAFLEEDEDVGNASLYQTSPPRGAFRLLSATTLAAS